MAQSLDDIYVHDDERSHEENREQSSSSEKSSPEKSDPEKSAPEKNNPEKRAVVYTVNHNEFGPLSPRGWLRYLELHARMESKSIK